MCTQTFYKLLKELHWLPDSDIIQYRILVQTVNAESTTLPQYILFFDSTAENIEFRSFPYHSQILKNRFASKPFNLLPQTIV